MEVRFATTECNGGLQDDYSSRAIHVVVAVDENAFFTLDGRVEAIDGSSHASEEIRRVELIDGWGEERPGIFRRIDSAQDKQFGESRTSFRIASEQGSNLLLEGLHAFGVRFSKIPAQSKNLHHRGHRVKPQR